MRVLLELLPYGCGEGDEGVHVIARVGLSALSAEVAEMLAMPAEEGLPPAASTEEAAYSALDGLDASSALPPVSRLRHVARTAHGWLRTCSPASFAASSSAAQAHLTHGALLGRLFALLAASDGFMCFLLGVPVLERAINEVVGATALLRDQINSRDRSEVRARQPSDSTRH